MLRTCSALILGWPSFTGALLGLTGFDRLWLGLIEFYLYYWALLGFTRFYWVLLGFIGFYWVLLGFIGFYWVLLGFTGFHWVSLVLAWFYCNIPSLTWSFCGFECSFAILLGRVSVINRYLLWRTYLSTYRGTFHLLPPAGTFLVGLKPFRFFLFFFSFCFPTVLLVCLRLFRCRCWPLEFGGGWFVIWFGRGIHWKGEGALKKWRTPKLGRCIHGETKGKRKTARAGRFFSAVVVRSPFSFGPSKSGLNTSGPYPFSVRFQLPPAAILGRSYWVTLSFTGFLLNCDFFSRFQLVPLNFPLVSNESHILITCFSCLHSVTFSYISLHWVILGCVGLYWLTVGYIGLHWVTLGYVG